ncbi:SCO family protein [Roseovarius sp. 217]|uniref:SCO family protein n=1 Tax=Roseovarius sp. (strain 217) TaxID=314264 RepID=UPI0000685582|nr:SCO family protein [Roseovarius sp. 217]EAQ24920.1 probable lipoprotein [Roseovarius sp. 217]
MDQTSNADGLRRIRRGLWALTGVAAVALGAAVLWQARTTPAALPGTRVTGEAAISNAYTLIDHTGRSVTADSFDGQWQLVFFGFTHCPDICPTTLAYMAQVMDELGPKAAQVTPIFITVDPARDTRDVMAAYVEALHPRMVGLIGTEGQVAEAARNFRVWYERTEDEAAPDGYTMAHSGYIYVLAPDGRFVDVWLEGDAPAESFANNLSTLLQTTGSSS